MDKIKQVIRRWLEELERDETFSELTARIKSDAGNRIRKDLEELKKGWRQFRNRGG